MPYNFVADIFYKKKL